MENTVFVIIGPTSSGKTSLALELQKEYNGKIISADSRQIYKEMDIGTGKVPIGKDKDNLKIYGYDLVYPNEKFTSYDYARYALELINNTQGKVFLVGGTGLYVDMVTGAVQPSNIKPNYELRKKLSNLSLEELRARLAKLSIEEYSKIDKNNYVRLIRAIEKLENTEENDPLKYSNKTFIKIGLTSSREYLYEKADFWAEFVWENGLIEETKYLFEKYGNIKKLNGLVYKSAIGHLEKKLSKADAIQRTKYDLHSYIRRQQTYFKKMKDIIWIDISKDNYRQKVYNITNE